MTTQILCSLVFFAAALFLAARIPVREGEHGPAASKAVPISCFCLLLAAALVLRLVLGYSYNGFDTDIACFKAWSMYTHEIGFGEMYYSDFFIDYPPGYLYVLYLVEGVRRFLQTSPNAQSYTLLIKMAPILSDLVCAAVLWVLSRRRLGENGALFVSGAYAFCPAVIINSAVWGQSDSFCAMLLLLCVLLLWKHFEPLAAVVYGFGVLSKPQMLIFAPVLLLWVIRRRDWKSLILGVLLGAGTALLLALPFVKNGNFNMLISLYMGTMDYYSYFTINAYNLWCLFGLNWGALPEHSLWLQFGVPLAVILASWLCLRSKRDESVFAVPVVLMFTVFIFCVKMHERYLFPVLLSLLLVYIFTREKRFLLSFAFTSLLHFLNVAYVLYLNNAYIEPTSPQLLALSMGHILAYGYTMYTVWRVFLAKKAPAPLFATAAAPGSAAPAAKPRAASAAPKVLLTEQNRDVKLRLPDVLTALVITGAYAFLAFTALGAHETANTSWTPNNGDYAVFETDGAYTEAYFLPGIVPDQMHYAARVGHAFRLEVSDDLETWRPALENTDGEVYTWQTLRLRDAGRYIRITSTCDDLTLNELALKRADGSGFVSLTQSPVGGSVDGAALVDEQDAVPLYPSYMHSMYFDEIYHARTAYEHILGLEPYENTHPTLGKLIISLGIRIFGMNPFGWRFMGTLFGVLMLPILYHLLKRLFGSTFLSATGTFLMAFDFMHYTQTRITTIDTYAVFFILLMYDAMVVFLQSDILRDGWKKTHVPLFFSGLFMGLGVASKWTVAYGAVGLAVLYFGKLGFTYRAVVQNRDKSVGMRVARFKEKAITLCLWCVLFFIAIPFSVYFAAFLPLTTLPWNSYNIVDRFFAYQFHMYNYHSTLKATHTFESPWYQWPFDIRVVWYYGKYDADGIPGAMRTISVLGSPLFWWAGAAAVVWSFWGAFKKRAFPALVAAVGFLSAYIPWVLVPRCTFIYHYFTAVPFMLIALLWAMRNLSRLPALAAPLFRFGSGGNALTVSRWTALVFLFLAVHAVLFVVFYPVLTGALTSQAYANSLEWLPTWFFA